MGIIKYFFGKKDQGNNSSTEKEELNPIPNDPTQTTTTSALPQSTGFWKNLFIKNELNDTFFDKLEEELIGADLGAQVTVETVEKFRTTIKEKKIKKIDLAIQEFKTILGNLLIKNELSFAENQTPVICLVGVNGTGKTTTLAKLAHYYQQRGNTIIMAAADTFRAAATIQLEEWAKRLQTQFISKGENADAAAVAYDAVEATIAKKNSLCLIDTAGRLENKTNLMEQLSKLIRIINRFEEKIDCKKILILDATLGRNGVDQAKVFTEKIGLDGIILTKIDTQARGGFLLTISKEFQLPIFFITHGEKIDALSLFDHEEYLNTILSHFQ